ncbi:mechanosensitive ion channel [Prolixibacteraceae bacterium JC049]|nr:mechanosensitive ion channel [Prolixibacteraceae bacterium JC049]
MEKIESFGEMMLDLVKLYGPKLVYAIIVFFIGLWVVKILTNVINRLMDQQKIDASLRPFLKSLFSMLLKTLLVITVLGMLGVEMTSFIAVLGAAGLAVGMALSGTLQNFAGGVMILLFKPFKVGEFIEAQGYMGVVNEIQIFNTILTTPDNKVIVIPNGGLSTGSLVNYSRLETRRVDFTFGIGYDDDIDKARSVIRKTIDANEHILHDPEPFIAVSELADSSVNFAVRVWVKSENYWNVHFYMLEQVKKAFDKEGISIPYPQTDVHVHQVK